MRKKIALIGVIVLVIGVVLVAAGLAGTLSMTKTYTHSTEISSTEWTTSEINMTSGGLLTVTGATGSDTGLVTSADLSSVNSSNIASYAVAPNNTVHGTVTFEGLSGHYYYVVFSSSSPSISAVYINNIGNEVVYAAMLVPGGVLAFIGFVVAIIGVILKKKPQGPPQ
ncbi:MAG: hypothetical protein B2I17_00590 [Thermoplasmatales archaeon B_DKE]|nr:MAG: hypothetical protein B2I17_00590 [Thermoplasmatales archaeon B_DKE]QRF75641.1 hypothetical protein Thermo_01147 [Thermoplasmatales archaeon]